MLIVIENTNLYAITIQKVMDDSVISVFEKGKDNIITFSETESKIFYDALQYVHVHRDRPGSMHYMKTLNESIEYLIDQIQKGNKDVSTQ